MIIHFLLAAISSYLTFLLHKKYCVTNILASSLVTTLLVGSLKVVSLYLILDFDLYAKLIFGASFVGMCCPKRFKAADLLYINTVFVLLFYFILNIFPFSSGTLGFIAFLAVSIVIALKKSYSFFTSEAR